MKKYYKFRYHLNAEHSLDNRKESAHTHTFSISLYIELEYSEEILLFSEFDYYMQEYLQQFNGKYLNELSIFQGEIPSIEGIGDYIYDDLSKRLRKGIQLIQLEICEMPLRIYIVSKKLLFYSFYKKEYEEQLNRIIEEKKEQMKQVEKKKRG